MRIYTLGVDPAPALSKRSDDGGLIIGYGMPKPGLQEVTASPADWVYCYCWGMVLRGASIDEWSGMLHHLHRRFHFHGILMDWNGGGNYVMGKLNKVEQNIHGIVTRCRPIACPEDTTVGDADFILHMLKRGDVGIESLWPQLSGDDVLKDVLHVTMQQAVEHCETVWPRPLHDLPLDKKPEQGSPEFWAHANLDAMRAQLGHIQANVMEDGSWQTTIRGARQFITTAGKDDLAYAGIYAYVRFLIWLRNHGDDLGEDRSGGELVCEEVPV